MWETYACMDTREGSPGGGKGLLTHKKGHIQGRIFHPRDIIPFGYSLAMTYCQFRGSALKMPPGCIKFLGKSFEFKAACSIPLSSSCVSGCICRSHRYMRTYSKIQYIFSSTHIPRYYPDLFQTLPTRTMAFDTNIASMCTSSQVMRIRNTEIRRRSSSCCAESGQQRWRD